MYKYLNTKQRCVHVINICDNSGDCPLGDGKLDCNLKDIKCPSRCNCLLLAIDCRHAQDLYVDIKSLSLYVSIYLLSSSISFLKKAKMLF